MRSASNQNLFHNDRFIALISASVLSFTLLFFGPSYIYFTNVLQLPFTFAQIFIYWIGLSIIVTIIIFVLLLIIPKPYFKIASCLVFGFGLSLWIQGQILVWNYGPLDGREILWNNYFIYGIIDIAIWITVILIILIKNDSVYPYLPQICIFLILIQAGGLIISAYTAPSEPTWKSNSFDDRDMFLFSKQTNVIIVLLDNFQSNTFQEIINEDPSFKKIFAGFTYYPNTVGGYSSTTANIPLILTSEYYNNSVPIDDFMENSYLSSSLLKTLKYNGFRVDIYDSNFLVYPSSELESNVVPIDIDISELTIYYKLTFFRFSPHFIKPIFYQLTTTYC